MTVQLASALDFGLTMLQAASSNLIEIVATGTDSPCVQQLTMKFRHRFTPYLQQQTIAISAPIHPCRLSLPAATHY